ncbi:MAG: phage tail protein [Fluviicola sp.]
MSSSVNPILAYRFYIEYAGNTGSGVLRAQSVSGLGFTLNLTEFNSTGGPKAMPSDVTYTDLVVKRAVIESKESISESLELLLDTLQVQQLEMAIYLLNDVGDYTRAWLIKGAYTTKWSTTDFDASSNSVIIETMEFKYDQLIQVL